MIRGTAFFVVALLVCEAHAALYPSGTSLERKQVSLRKKSDERNPLYDAARAIGEATGIVKPKEKKEEKDKKEQMDPVEVMRGELCWNRDDLIEHDECMSWMVEKCEKETSGHGFCDKVKGYVKKQCAKGNEKACKYAKRMGIDTKALKDEDPEDSDGDGVKDADDAFPMNPLEWSDKDGDGFGDNSDAFPDDPNCHTKICGPAPAPAAAPAPAPAPEEEKKQPAPAPAPAPAKEEEKPAPAPAPETSAPAPAPPKPAAPKGEAIPGGYEDPVAKKGLASQGFSGGAVKHVDGETLVGDWGKEYGNHKGGKDKHSGSTSQSLHKLALTSLIAMALARAIA